MAIIIIYRSLSLYCFFNYSCVCVCFFFFASLLHNEAQKLLGALKIAVIGLAASNAIYHAGGSGSVEPSFVSTPLEGSDIDEPRGNH